jgi:16S rRNA (cytidine1402-2'-O)-methyltransferase
MPDRDEDPIAPGLYIVATPIGNLEDITLRALRVLRDADLIACEDTRQTRKLLSHYGIATPSVSYHQHNERERAAELIEKLRSGGRVALVSDAGTPAVSDPGLVLVEQAVSAGISVIPIPGPAAAISALSASGLDTSEFRFVGFLPSRAGARRQFLEVLQTDPATLIFYEAPHRIAGTLHDAREVFGPDRRAVLVRELTKVHEEFLRGTLAELEQEIVTRGEVRGEITLLIAGADPAKSASQETGGSLRERIDFYRAEGLDEQAALKRIARERGVGKSEVYRQWQQERRRS